MAVFAGVMAILLFVVVFSTNISGEQSSTNIGGFKKSNDPMTVELVCGCMGAEDEVDPVEVSGIFAMYVQVCSAISVHSSD